MWVIGKSVLARLEGFHIRAAYKMARRHVSHRGPNRQWIYPKSANILDKCGMHNIQHYIDEHRQTIAANVVNCSIFTECRESERRRGLVPRQWWWEQRMCLDATDALGSSK